MDRRLRTVAILALLVGALLGAALLVRRPPSRRELVTATAVSTPREQFALTALPPPIAAPLVAAASPSEKRAFNLRKAEMTARALKSVSDQIRYPLWAGPLTDNMRYQKPEPAHAESRGPGGADPTLEVWPDKLNYALGEPISIFAAARTDEKLRPLDRVSGHTASGLRPRPSVELAFADRGDGVHAALLDLPREVALQNRGEWSFAVEAVIDGQARHVMNHFRVMATDATLTGAYRLAVEEGSLVLYATINSSSASVEHLKGELWSARGEPISYAWVRSDQTPVGESALRLVFYGKVIRDRGLDGPYRIRNLVLTTFDSRNDPLENPVVDPNLTTAAYSHLQFTAQDINAGNAVLEERRQILEEELAHAKNNDYDPASPIPARPTHADKSAPPPQ